MADFGDILAADAVGKTVQERFATFLREYETPHETRGTQSGEPSPSAEGGIREYINQIRMMREFDATTIFIDYEHLVQYDRVVAEAIREEFYRYEPHLRRAVQDVVKDVEPDFLYNEGEMKQLFVAFFNTLDVLSIRDLTMRHVAHLVSFAGTVTRTSEVRPELMIGRFTCGDCGAAAPAIEQQFKYTEPSTCSDTACSNRRKFRLDVSRSKFVDWQRVRVQENADEIPAGSMPRSVDVILRHGAVDRAKAGDRVIFTGCLVVVPDLSQLQKAGAAPTSVSRPAGGRAMGAGEGVTGLKALGVRDLTYRTAFVAHAVARMDNPRAVNEDVSGDADKAAAGSGAEAVPDEKVKQYEAMANSGTVYHDLVQSIVPSIHGHDELKKGLLLMLLGGVHKSSAEGMKLRGDINVCIVGDPSTAKSQFLKYAVKFAPRAIYTSGKASSAAGLTASVAKDPDTGEFTIEAGALMLADNGICCIDEFDKMDPADQVAIHEAMEQQTISITKAGIQATLNARTSILAAANPVYGRYDRTKTLRQNLNISAPIMSRFDLFYVVLDELDEASDERIANHIVSVHQKGAAALAETVVYPMALLQEYVAYAKSTVKPELTEEAKSAIINVYKLLRQNDSLNASGSSYRVTVRQLESVIRLSEALARLHLSERVSRKFVMEAYRLIKTSMLKVDHSDVPLEEAGGLGLGEEDDDGGLGLRGNDDGAADALLGVVPGGGDADPRGKAQQAGGEEEEADAPAQQQPGGSPARKAAAPAGKRTQISEDAFHKMTMSFALALRQQERSAADAAADRAAKGLGDTRSDAERAEAGGMPFEALVNTWIQDSGVLERGGTKEEVAVEESLARKVLRKLLRGEEGALYLAPLAPMAEGEPAPAAVPEGARFVFLNADFVITGID